MKWIEIASQLRKICNVVTGNFTPLARKRVTDAQVFAVQQFLFMVQTPEK